MSAYGASSRAPSAGNQENSMNSIDGNMLNVGDADLWKGTASNISC
jgi:hypothetical protein